LPVKSRKGAGEYQDGHYEEPGGKQCYGYQQTPELAVVGGHIDRAARAVSDLSQSNMAN
jgi:hypothetical protein